MLSTILTSSVYGMEGNIITAEIDCAQGFPGWTIVGLPDTTVKESKERIKAAFKNSQLEFPNNFHITINLAPANVPKEGSGFDLPIAVGLLINMYKLRQQPKTSLFIGECALDGSIRPINGALSIAITAKKMGIAEIFLPKNNAQEALLIPNIQVYGCTSLQEIYEHLAEIKKIEPTIKETHVQDHHANNLHNFENIHGQPFAKRALTIAAAGGHNVLMSGSPGSGKTLLAQALPSIMPSMTETECIETTQIYSVAGLLNENNSLMRERPFRAPHHTSSAVALTGGGTIPKPGEVSLAHHGVLFLDEFPEFPRAVLEILRQPLENGMITISRAYGSFTFPAECMLIAAQNPCPCGFAQDKEQHCTCTASQLLNYQKKISGPLLDRIDIKIAVRRISFDAMQSNNADTQSSVNMRENVLHARERAQIRLPNIPCNARMRAQDIKKHCAINNDARELLQKAYETLHMSGRGLHKTLKVARTIADLDNAEKILLPHIAEALQLRMME